jgi:hypothetical protein
MGAEMPDPAGLPPALAGLAFRNAAQIRPDPDFNTDMDRLLRVVDRLTADPDRHPEAPVKPRPSRRAALLIGGGVAVGAAAAAAGWAFLGRKNAAGPPADPPKAEPPRPADPPKFALRLRATTANLADQHSFLVPNRAGTAVLVEGRFADGKWTGLFFADGTTGEHRLLVKEFKPAHRLAGFSADERAAVSGCREGLVFWSVTDGGRLEAVESKDFRIHHTDPFSMSPTGTELVVRADWNEYRLVHLRPFSVGELPFPKGRNHDALTITADGTRIGFCTDDQFLVWDARAWLRHRAFVPPHDLKVPHPEQPKGARYETLYGTGVISPDGRRAAAVVGARWDETLETPAIAFPEVQVIDVESGATTHTLGTAEVTGHADPKYPFGFATTYCSYRLVLNADGTLLIVYGCCDRIHVWDLRAGARVFTSDLHGGAVLRAALRGGDRVLVTLSADGAIRWWDVER